MPKRKRPLRSDNCSPISKFFKKAPLPATDLKGKEPEEVKVLAPCKEVHVSENCGSPESENCGSPNKDDKMYGHRGRGQWPQGGPHNTWNNRGGFQNSQGFYGNQNQQFHGRQGGGPHQNFQHGIHQQNNSQFHTAQQQNHQFQGMQQHSAQYRGQHHTRPHRGMQPHGRSNNQENVQYHGLSNTIPVHVNQRTDTRSARVPESSQGAKSRHLDKVYSDTQRIPADLPSDPADNHYFNTRERKSESRHYSECKYSVSEATISNPYHEGRKWERDYREGSSKNGDEASSKHHTIRSSSESSRSSKNLDEDPADDSHMYLSRSSSEGHGRNSQKDLSRNSVIRSFSERNSRNLDEGSAKNHAIRYSSEKTSRNLDQESSRNHVIRYSPERSSRNLDEKSSRNHVIRTSSEGNRRNLDEEPSIDPLTRSSAERRNRKLDESSPKKHFIRNDIDEGSSRNHALRFSAETRSSNGDDQSLKYNVTSTSSKSRERGSKNIAGDSFRYHVNRSREKSYDNKDSSPEPVRSSSCTESFNDGAYYEERSTERHHSNSPQHEKRGTHSHHYMHTSDISHRSNAGFKSQRYEKNGPSAHDFMHKTPDITIHHSYARPSAERFANSAEPERPLSNKSDYPHHRSDPQSHCRHDHSYPQHWSSKDNTEGNECRNVNVDADRRTEFSGQCRFVGESRERQHRPKSEKVPAQSIKVDDCTSPPLKVTKVRHGAHEDPAHPKDHSQCAVHPRNRKSNVLKDDKPIHQKDRNRNIIKDDKPVQKRTDGRAQKNAVKKQKDGKLTNSTPVLAMQRGAHNNPRNYIDCSPEKQFRQSHGTDRKTLLPTPPYPTQGRQYTRGGGGRGRVGSGRGMNNTGRGGLSPGRAGANTTGRGVTTSSSLRQAEERARRPRHNRGIARRGMNERREPQSVPLTQGAVEPVSRGGREAEWSMRGGRDFSQPYSQADLPISQAANGREQKPTQDVVQSPASNSAALGVVMVQSESSHSDKDAGSALPEESSINELLNDLPEEELHEPVKGDSQKKDSIDGDKTDVQTIKSDNSDVDKLESKLKDTNLENSPTTADDRVSVPDDHPPTPDDGSDDEFDLEEIEVVPALSQGQGQSAGISGVVVKEEGEGEEEEEVGEYVQKGLQNLRNMFKGRVSPASSCSEVTSLRGDDDSDKETEMRSPQRQPSSSSSGVMRNKGDSDVENEPTTSAWKPRSYSHDSDDYVFDIAMPDDDEESDDDDLLDAPSILQNKKPAATSMVKPKPLIMPSGSEDEAEAEPAPKADPSDVFSLDTLLTEREQKEETDRQFAEMEAELQKDIRSGGIRNLAAEATDEMMADHRLQLKQMELVEQVICDHHPGDLVFDPARYERTFSYPGSLTLQSCGFKPGSSQIDKHLSTLEPELIAEMLTSEVIEMCFCAISTPHAFLTWLFQLISVHDNRLVVQQSRAIIYRVLRQTNNKATDWVPSLATIKRVFVNMGADELSLCRPCAMDENKNKVKKETAHQGAAAAAGSADNSHQGAAPGGDVQQDVTRTYKLENLRLVLNAISDAVHLRSSCYKVGDVVSIMVMVFKVSLDKRLNQQTLDYDIIALLSSLIYAIPTDDWPNKVVELCRVVPILTKHHHNMVHMVTLLPSCDRGRYLQRRLAYSVLLHLYNKELTRETVSNFKLHHLHPLLAEVTIKGDSVDYYLISTTISLVDLAVGNEDLASREKNDLVMLMNILKSKMSDVRESINIIDRTMVKDQMVRLCSKWTFLLQNMGSSERTIFAYTTVSEPVKIESVVTRDHADSDPEELDSIPME